MTIDVQIVGQLEFRRAGELVELPSSRKARALLAYLVGTGRQCTRQALCEIFWDDRDDPLAGLRWAISRLRSHVNTDDQEVLKASRDQVWCDMSLVAVDKDTFNDLVNGEEVDEKTADKVWREVNGIPLEGIELGDHASFSIWVEGLRADYTRQRALIAKRYARDEALAWEVRDKWAERWLKAAPFSQNAAKCAFECKHYASGEPAALGLARKLTEEFALAEVEAPLFELDSGAERRKASRLSLAPSEQNIRFVRAADATTIAWASIGSPSNPPLIKAANWLNHLELDWDAPIWSPLFKRLSQTHHFIRYDERGCGLSDWDVEEISFDKFVEDLESVVEATGLERFPLLGISQGAAVSIRYAALYPERVSKLVLFGAYDQGWRHLAPPEEVREREAVMVLTETGWGMDNPIYRHMFSRTFMPDASPDELNWFDEFQRLTTSSVNAVQFLEAFSSIDVSDDLAKIECPTLVVHSRGDMRIPFATGRSIATSIRDAQLVSLESNNHLLLGSEPASNRFVELVNDFLRKD